MPSDAQALSEYVAEHLPLSTAMGARVEEAGDAGVTLLFPIGPNLNHERTAFGGSLSAAGMLAGWSLIWLRARHLTPTPRLVIAESQTRFIRPVDADFLARAAWPRDDSWAMAADALARHGRAKLSIRTELVVHDRVAAVHDGDFAVIARPASG